MQSSELINMIQKLKRQCSIEDAFIGFSFDEVNEYECNIRANKFGLILFSIQLLEASLEFEKREFIENENYKIKNFSTLKHSDFLINNIELLNNLKRELKDPTKHKVTIKERLTNTLGVIFLILVLVSIPIGIFKIFEWIF